VLLALLTLERSYMPFSSLRMNHSPLVIETSSLMAARVAAEDLKMLYFVFIY
jgi:hypothetical protein